MSLGYRMVKRSRNREGVFHVGGSVMLKKTAHEGYWTDRFFLGESS
jgi:hypothetical protein